MTTSERHTSLGILLLCVLAVLAPALPQPQEYHHFADARTLWGVPRALDSLSNVGFLVLGVYGLWLAAAGRLVFISTAMRASVFVFFVGMVATAAGSTYYHLAPDDAGLLIDRFGMVIVFAGVLGMAATHRLSDRAGWVVTGLALVSGPFSLAWWAYSGSVSPYAVVQFGGIALACALMLAPPRGPGPLWTVLLATYALAKVAEGADAFIFELSGHLVSGHTLKHILAALPVLAVTRGMLKTRKD